MDSFFCRLIPLVRSLISIPAGMAHMNFWVFLIVTTAGTLIWNVILVNIRKSVGSSWGDIVSYMDIYSNVVYVLLVLFFTLLVLLVIKKNK
jgi:membrane protein DedA with SNARE-associated domain